MSSENEYVDEGIDSLEPSSTEIQKKNKGYLKLNTSDTLSFWGLILTGIGIYLAIKSNEMNESMLRLATHSDSLSVVQTNIANIQFETAKRQDSTAQSLQEFARLLGKTDTIMHLSASQVELATRTQKQANNIYEQNLIGSMNRLFAKAEAINYYYLDIKELYYPLVGDEITTNKPMIAHKKARMDTLAAMFASEMENEYLNTHQSLHKLWTNAYKEVVGMQHIYNELLYHPAGSSIYTANDIGSKYIKCCGAMGGTAHYIMNQIKDERKHLGYYKSFNVGDIVTLITDRKTEFTIVEDKGNGEYKCVYVDNRGLKEDAYLSSEFMILVRKFKKP